jgi:putative phosphoribosyl transferase
MKIFRDRDQAGAALGEHLRAADVGAEPLVLGLPRGGIPVACAVAAALDAPVEALVVRKLGAPFNPELALGAIAFGGVTVYNDDLLAQLGMERADLEPVRQRELAELARRETAYRAGRPAPQLAGKTAVIVDDGIATGATMRAAIVAARALHPARIVAAAPTGAVDSVARLEAVADRVVTLATPEPYYGVGAWYDHFPQLSDDQVVDALAAAALRASERQAQ